MNRPTLVLFSKFPIGFNRRGKPIGTTDLDVNYPRDSLVILSIPSKLRRCMILPRYTINTATFRTHRIPKRVFIYPNSEPEPRFLGLAYGVLVKQNNTFLPVFFYAPVREEDIKGLERIIERRQTERRGRVNLDEILRIFAEMGFSFERFLADGEVRLRVKDEERSLQYDVVIDPESMRVIKTNVCIEGDLSLVDLLLLVRSRYDTYIYDPLF